MRGMMAGAAMAALVLGTGAARGEPDKLAIAFGARENIENGSLSPDGTKLAFVSPSKGQGAVILVLDVTDENAKPMIIGGFDGKPERLSGCRWVGSSRLMCTIYGIVRLDGGDIAYSSRIFAIDSDGKNPKGMPMPRGVGIALSSGSVIDWNPGVENSVLLMRQQLGDGNADGMGRGGYRVDRVDTNSLKISLVERADADAREYITDGAGRVRIIGRVKTDSASGYDLPGRGYFYRDAAGAQSWKPLSTIDAQGDGFDPHGVDAATNVAYGLKRVDGRLAAYTKALDGSGKETLVFAHPDVDVSGFARIGRRGRIVGANYVTDRRQVQYFDPALAKLAASLARALPDTPLIRFLDSSEDENVMLLWAGADANPGRYYLFDRKGESSTRSPATARTSAA